MLTFRRQGHNTLPAAWVKTPVCVFVVCVSVLCELCCNCPSDRDAANSSSAMFAGVDEQKEYGLSTHP